MSKVKSGSILAAAAVAGLIAGTAMPSAGTFSIGSQAMAKGSGCPGGCGGKDGHKCEKGKDCKDCKKCEGECKCKHKKGKEGKCNGCEGKDKH